MRRRLTSLRRRRRMPLRRVLEKANSKYCTIVGRSTIMPQHNNQPENKRLQ